MEANEKPIQRAYSFNVLSVADGQNVSSGLCRVGAERDLARDWTVYVVRRVKPPIFQLAGPFSTTLRPVRIRVNTGRSEVGLDAGVYDGTPTDYPFPPFVTTIGPTITTWQVLHYCAAEVDLRVEVEGTPIDPSSPLEDDVSAWIAPGRPGEQYVRFSLSSFDLTVGFPTQAMAVPTFATHLEIREPFDIFLFWVSDSGSIISTPQVPSLLPVSPDVATIVVPENARYLMVGQNLGSTVVVNGAWRLLA